MVTTVSREEFLERRKSGIGGADVAAILGLSKWKTPYQVWADKTGRSPEKDESEYLHWGNVLEQVVADEFVLRNPGRKVQRRNEMFRSKEHPELIADIDRYIVGGGVLECKTSNAFALSDWGETGSDNVPEYYLTQVQHYMYVTGYHEAVLAVLIGGNHYRQYEIGYDAELTEWMAAKCVEFWNEYVLKDCPPPVTVRDDLKSIFPGNAGEVKTADAAFVKMLNDYCDAQNAEKEAKKQKEIAASELKLWLENAESVVDGDGKTLLTYRKSKDTVATITDWEQLAREMLPPGTLSDEVIERFTQRGVVTRPGSRMIKVK